MPKFIELEEIGTGKKFLINTDHVRGIGYYDETGEKGTTLYIGTLKDKFYTTTPYNKMKELLKPMIVGSDNLNEGE